MGNVLGGICDVLMACSDALMAYALVKMSRVAHLSGITAKALGEFMEQADQGCAGDADGEGRQGHRHAGTR